jgi:hypothetical protein
MKGTKRRGRPKLETTLLGEEARQKLEEVVQEAKTRAVMSDSDRHEMQIFLDRSAEWERQTREQWHIAPMKMEWAYAAASLGDESLEGYELLVEAEYLKALSKGQAARASGTNFNQREAVDRKKSFLSRHGELINKLVGRGFSTSQIAETIFRQNANTMRPSVRTIRRWISEYRTK